MKCPNCFGYIEEIKKLEKEIERLKTIQIEGWQGKDRLNIIKLDTEWKITEHRKDKQTGEVATITHTIPEINVANVWQMIIERIHIGEKTISRNVAGDIIAKFRLPVGIDEFWGGKYRSKYLFPLLYYPLKILEKNKFIKYGGRGDITRLR